MVLARRSMVRRLLGPPAANVRITQSGTAGLKAGSTSTRSPPSLLPSLPLPSAGLLLSLDALLMSRRRWGRSTISVMVM
jgi:hypothetical protein